MNLDSILQLFVVKEKRFFPLFNQASQNICKAADYLLQQTREVDPDNRRMIAHRIKECETAGDQITNRIVDEILDAFVTPFDRDDIHELAERMDTFLDNIRDSSKKIAMYQPAESTPQLVSIAEYIKKDAELLLKITNKFETMRKEVKELDALCDEIKEVEHIVDDVYESYISHIFANESNALELIKKQSIAQALEDTTDIAKSVSNTIRGIVVKMG